MERVQKRTVRFEVEQKFKGSSVHLVPMYAGYGRSGTFLPEFGSSPVLCISWLTVVLTSTPWTGSLLGTELLTMAGIRDASIRFSGRRHPVNRLIAFFMALEKVSCTASNLPLSSTLQKHLTPCKTS